MKKKKGSKAKEILDNLALSMVIIFPMIACFYATAAWFSSNRKANSENGGFDTTLPKTLVDKVEVFEEIKDSDGNNTYYTYNNTPNATWSSSSKSWSYSAGVTDIFGMGTYSMLSSEHSSLILIKISDSATDSELEKFNLSVYTTTDYDSSLVKYDKDTLSYNSLKNSGNPMSSVITFKFFSLTEYPDTTSSIIDFTSKKSDATNGFYSLNDNTEVDESSYSTSISSGLSLTTSTKYIGLIIDYFGDGLQYIYSLNVGNEVLESEDPVTFNCDWGIRG